MRTHYRERYRQNNHVRLTSILRTLSALYWQGSITLGIAVFALFYGAALLLEIAISQQPDSIFQPITENSQQLAK